MEHNLPMTSKKIWNIVRGVFYMMRKGMSKRRIMADLHMMMKRGKIAGKAIGNLMFSHNHHHPAASGRRSHDSRSSSSSSSAAGSLEYEFSCSNSPAFPFHLPSLHAHKRKCNQLNHHLHNLFMCVHPPPTQDDDADAVVGAFNFDKAIMEMLSSQRDAVEASPMLPGFGRTPLVRPLRITDSPFPLKEDEGEEDPRVDKEAAEFIQQFYKKLRQEEGMDG
ncbi:uncharacterized protein LOC115737401 [Rhodamnia argentea]|uniref:Uncharacterized protein LOC115737401 n=1 Tax=Rhodamnia argentea TaxID=178133 RepID=A0A8B8NS86_9MYRT|nr:uncharacterized protein LOC115737401 [Rhodamnia argentea]